MYNSPQPHESKNTPEETIKHLNELIEFARNWILDNSEVEIIKNLATKNREPAVIEGFTGAEPGKNLSWWERIDTIRNYENQVTTQEFIDLLLKEKIEFNIFWTDGQRAWHGLQYAAGRKILGIEHYTEIYWISQDLQNDNTVMFVQFRKQWSDNLLTLRVADTRTDKRWWWFTMIGFPIASVMERGQFQEFAQDTDWLKEIMRIVLKEARSPLQWAEEKVTKSFLV